MRRVAIVAIVLLSACGKSGTPKAFSDQPLPIGPTATTIAPEGFNDVSGHRFIFFDVIATPRGDVDCIVDQGGDAESVSCDWAKLDATPTTTTTTP